MAGWSGEAQSSGGWSCAQAGGGVLYWMRWPTTSSPTRRATTWSGRTSAEPLTTAGSWLKDRPKGSFPRTSTSTSPCLPRSRSSTERGAGVKSNPNPPKLRPEPMRTAGQVRLVTTDAAPRLRAKPMDQRSSQGGREKVRRSGVRCLARDSNRTHCEGGGRRQARRSSGCVRDPASLRPGLRHSLNRTASCLERSTVTSNTSGRP